MRACACLEHDHVMNLYPALVPYTVQPQLSEPWWSSDKQKVRITSQATPTNGWLRCRLSFSLLRSAIQAIRGARWCRGRAAVPHITAIDLITSDPFPLTTKRNSFVLFTCETLYTLDYIFISSGLYNTVFNNTDCTTSVSFAPAMRMRKPATWLWFVLSFTSLDRTGTWIRIRFPRTCTCSATCTVDVEKSRVACSSRKILWNCYGSTECKHPASACASERA